MSEPITIKYILTRQDWLRARRLHSLRSLGIFQVLVVIVGALFYSLIFYGYGMTGPELATWTSLTAVSILVFIYLMRLFVHPYVILKRIPSIVGERTCEFSEEGIHAIVPNGESRLKWEYYKSARIEKNFYMLYHEKHAFSVFPRRAFANAEQEKAFEEMLRRHIADVK